MTNPLITRVPLGFPQPRAYAIMNTRRGGRPAGLGHTATPVPKPIGVGTGVGLPIEIKQDNRIHTGTPVAFEFPIRAYARACAHVKKIHISSVYRCGCIYLHEKKGKMPTPMPTPMGFGTGVAVWIALKDLALATRLAFNPLFSLEKGGI